MSRVAVVTDSTAYLPDGVAQGHGIAVVPLHVVLGAITGTENVDLSPADVAKALHERRIHVSTSRPTPAEFEAAYRATGATQIVSAHLSARLSGTADSARLAAQAVAADGIEVRVVDSGSLAMGLGFPVIAGAESATAGGSFDEVADAVVAATSRTTTLFYVDTLEHLRRGGRMGAASALVGAALGVKPLLQVKDGEIGLLEKVRTASRAVARMVAVAAANDHPVEVAVHHLESPDRAAQLAADLQAALPHVSSLVVSEIGAVVGAHTGPGCLGVVLWQR